MTNSPVNDTSPTDGISEPDTQVQLDTLLGAEPRGVTRHWLSLMILAAAAVGAVGFFVRFVVGEDSPYYVATIEQGDLTPLVSERGLLHGSGEVTVSASETGRMTWVSGKTDGAVKKGELLAIIDTGQAENEIPIAHSGVSAAEAAVASAGVVADDTAARLARFENVWKRSGGRAPSLNEIERARTEAQQANLALSAARAELTAAKLQLKDQQTRKAGTEVRAPISGTLVVRHAKPGQIVKQHQSLFTVAAGLGPLTIEVPLTGPQSALIQAGSRAQVRLDAMPDAPLSATLTKLRVSPPPQSAPPLAVFTVEHAVPQALPGMAATIEIELPTRNNVLLAPNPALAFASSPLQNSKRQRIYLLERGDAKRVYVTAGNSDGKRTEIFANGLKPGDAVIIGWRSDISDAKRIGR